MLNTVLHVLAIVLAVCGLLFGFGWYSRLDVPSVPDSRIEGQYYPKYSFDARPYVHPRIIEDLLGWVSDSGAEVISINTLEAQHSNRYFGEIFIAPTLLSLRKYSSPWIYSTRQQQELPSGKFDPLVQDVISSEVPIDYATIQVEGYRYLGSTPSGVDVLHVRSAGGGSLMRNDILFVTIAPGRIAAYQPLWYDYDTENAEATPEFERSELITLVGNIILGDRWYGTIEVTGNKVVVQGRSVGERCKVGGATKSEAIEMSVFGHGECDTNEPRSPPPVHVYIAPEI